MSGPAEPEPRLTMWGGRVGVATRAEWVRAAAGLAGLWAASLAGRALGCLGARGALHQLERLAARAAARGLGLRLELFGLEHVAPGGVYVVAPLHEGFADAIALLHLPLPLRFAARDELFGWPALGPFLRDTGQLEVCPERGAPSYRRLLREAGAVLEGGESLVVFPQGAILGLESDFNGGAFRLARALGRPLLPIALTGGHRVWEHPYTPRLRFGERVSLRVLPPIGAAELARRDPEAVRLEVSRRLKGAALGGEMAPPRRFVPARDGYWDGYAYRVDPDFPELAADVALHRAGLGALSPEPLKDPFRTS